MLLICLLRDVETCVGLFRRVCLVFEGGCVMVLGGCFWIVVVVERIVCH